MLDDKLEIENAEVLFKNFSGAQTQYNPAGERNFCVILDPEVAKELKVAGWNIRLLKGRMEGDEPKEYIQVKVSFKNYPPNVYLVTKRKMTRLDEDTIDMLDWAEIKKADVVIRPYNWEVNDKVGTKAYLKSLYVTIEEDKFAEKYADLPTDSEIQVRAAELQKVIELDV